jgi:hypothetical protein
VEGKLLSNGSDDRAYLKNVLCLFLFGHGLPPLLLGEEAAAFWKKRRKNFWLCWAMGVVPDNAQSSRPLAN